MVRLTDRPDMTLDVYLGRKTTIQQQELKDTLNYRSFCFKSSSTMYLIYFIFAGTKDLHVLVNESSNSNVTGI